MSEVLERVIGTDKLQVGDLRVAIKELLARVEALERKGGSGRK